MDVGGTVDVGETVGCGNIDCDGIAGGWTVDGCGTVCDLAVGGSGAVGVPFSGAVTCGTVGGSDIQKVIIIWEKQNQF